MTSSSGFEASPETDLSQLPDRRNEQFTIYAILVHLYLTDWLLK